MGRISGRPGPDPKVVYNEDDPKNDLFLSKQFREPACYSIVGNTKFIPGDEEFHAMLESIRPTLAELGFSIVSRIVGDINEPVETFDEDHPERYRRWSMVRRSITYVERAIYFNSGSTHDELAEMIYRLRGEPWPRETHRLACQKLRNHALKLLREGRVERRYREDGTECWFRPRGISALPKRLGGTAAPTYPVASDEGILAATRALTGVLGTIFPREREVMDNLTARDPAFFRDLTMRLYRLIMGDENNLTLTPSSDPPRCDDDE